MVYQSESEAVVMLAPGAFCSMLSISRLPNSRTRMPMSSNVRRALPARSWIRLRATFLMP